mmetsp:Transcript_35972/g.86834  ORF Transcript_35972/g.86834 Transcript_35972/m.86834 type:complete len:106 (+) Transcript_35972:84-401(+)
MCKLSLFFSCDLGGVLTREISLNVNISTTKLCLLPRMKSFESFGNDNGWDRCTDEDIIIIFYPVLYYFGGGENGEPSGNLRRMLLKKCCRRCRSPCLWKEAGKIE